MKHLNWKIVGAGALVGLGAALLMKLGNPGNMGICLACFIRDIAGALGLHSVEKLSVIRPEIPGFILGSLLAALAAREYKPRGGSSPAVRFILGVTMMIGALVFLGCPLRMILRLAGGDLNALVGLAGFVSGIAIGIVFLKRGFSLGRSYVQHKASGLMLPGFAILLLILLVAFPGKLILGAAHAPALAALVAGLLVGAAAQRTRLCTAGAFRDVILIRDFSLMYGVVAIFLAALIGNLILNPGAVNVSFAGQPAAHTDGLWNFLGLLVVGLNATLLGGCPLRQTILSGEGDNDAVVTFFGMLVGAGLSHNLGMAGSADGVALAGQAGTIVSLLIALAIAMAYTVRAKA